MKNKRLREFQPEPLIDPSETVVDATDIELSKPDESIPGCLNLAKVNYLNFIGSKKLEDEAESAIRKYGVGSCGPRGFYGTIDIHLTLESRLAEFMGVEETVLYSYGFSTTASAIGAYCKKRDILFCDEKINFAAYQGMVAAKSKIVYFKHNNMEDLERLLLEYQEKEEKKKQVFRKFLIVEGIYQATGTICPLPKLMELRAKYKLRIFIDETVSFGLLGKFGRGVTEHFDIDRTDVDMIIGSLEGSVGSVGGFCAGASIVIEHQRLSGLGYCFSASLPPFLSHVAISAIDEFLNRPEKLKDLENLSVKIDARLHLISKLLVVSDPISPLKVITITPSDEREGILKSIRAFCSDRHLYLLLEKDCLRFHLNVAMTTEDVVKVTDTLEEAVDKFVFVI